MPRAVLLVQSWSDTQIVAQVGAGSASGNAMVLAGSIMVNGGMFTVTGTPIISSVSPNSGTAGTAVTISGSGFGAAQGASALTLGSMAGQITSWSDAQIVATVAAGSLTGIAQVVLSGAKSNAEGFTVPVAGGNSVMPAMLNLLVGDTHTIQAVNGSGQPVTVTGWTSSDSTIVSLSTDNPPILTALAAGHVTIKGGTAAADVTVTDYLGGRVTLRQDPGSGAYSIVRLDGMTGQVDAR